MLSSENRSVGFPALSRALRVLLSTISPVTSRVRPIAGSKYLCDIPISFACWLVKKKNSFAPVAIPRITLATSPHVGSSDSLSDDGQAKPVVSPSDMLR